MVPLDSTIWGELTHAYGPASDIPDLLRRLAKEPEPSEHRDQEPWRSLWSALCHQGDVYQASYVAVPHIVAIANEAPGPIDWSFFGLPAAIEIARAKGSGPLVGPTHQAAYFAALRDLLDCIARHADDRWDEYMTQAIATALAAIKGHHRLADALNNLDDEWIEKILSPS